MLKIFAQARFPKPEFSGGYEYPSMGLETYVFSNDWLKVLAYLFLMFFVFFALYKLRSRKLLYFASLLSVASLGFYWMACPCPVGLTQNTLLSVLDANAYYPFVYFVIFTLPILAAMFFGRIFCGGACPLGALQEVVNLKSVKIPGTLNSVLKLLPYFILVFAGVVAMVGGPFLLCNYDPFAPIFRRAAPFMIAFFSGFMLLLSVFVSRPYCKYLCPYSVILKNVSLLSKRSVLIAPSECVNCRLCENSCPNDAILAPQTGRFFETPEVAKKRIRNILLFAPFAMVITAFAAWSFSAYITEIHPTVSLYAQVVSGVQNDYTEGFFASKTSVEQLKILADEAEFKLRFGLALGGALIAFFVILEILRSLKRRENTVYTVDMSNCLCCGRCYEACPDQMRRLNKK